MAESHASSLPLGGPEIAETAALGTGRERRRSGDRSRARDRMMDRATRDYPQGDALRGVRGVENLVLFIDDDLRETGMALGHVEAYLVEILRMLEGPKIRREEVHALASDTRVLDHIDMLVDNLETLRRRMTTLATNLR